MTNRISGDFGSDAMEAFRAAYAAQLANPEEHEIDPINGLPTDVISNTSPWLEHTGLWTANNGMSRDFKPNQPFNPKDYLPKDYMPVSEESDEEDFAPEVVYDEDEVEETEEPMSDEEYDALAERVWGTSDEEDEELVDYESDEPSEEFSDEGEDEEEDDLDDAEIEALIDEILNDSSEDDSEESFNDYETEDDYEEE
jgi:hypothetical protein